MATIKPNVSHLDHGLNAEHVLFVASQIDGITEFKILTVDLPEGLASLKTHLHGPATGEESVLEQEVFYKKRGQRVGETRMCLRSPVETRKLTMIVGPHDGEVILYTAYGGPVAPREPFDPDLKASEVAESVDFWAAHALSE